MDPVGFTFGDSRELCDRLLALVRSGAKTASCGALRDFEAGEDMPVVGRRDIALDWDGRPALMIETTEVTIRPFREVPEDFALAEAVLVQRMHAGTLARFGGAPGHACPPAAQQENR